MTPVPYYISRSKFYTCVFRDFYISFWRSYRSRVCPILGRWSGTGFGSRDNRETGVDDGERRKSLRTRVMEPKNYKDFTRSA